MAGNRSGREQQGKHHPAPHGTATRQQRFATKAPYQETEQAQATTEAEPGRGFCHALLLIPLCLDAHAISCCPQAP
jgi:hypothetical protein